jgi:cyclopropane fatty-acyl-phospholipid synthase-like methyltransferase
MDKLRSLEKTAIGFENSFSESLYYNFQTQDKNHLELLFDNLKLNPGKRILDLGTGSGYLAFPLAFQNHECHVIALDIVTNTIKKITRLQMKEKSIIWNSFHMTVRLSHFLRIISI